MTNIIVIIKFDYPYVMGKKTRHSHAGLHKGVAKRLKKGDVMDRFSRLLGKFSREKSEAKLASTLNKKAEAPEANANGTSGYLIKEGKNAGKILKHLKTDRTKL